MPLKKFILMCVFFCMLISLPGCDSERGGIEVSINVPANMNLLQALREQLPEFEQSAGVRVKLIPFTGQEKLYAMMAAGQPPDIFYTNTVVRDQLAAEGRLLDLRTIVSNDPLVERIRPQFIERGTSIDGGWYQFCDWTFTYGIYYQKSTFDQMQVPYPDSAWTWEGMLDRARQLTRDSDGDGKPDRYGIFIARHFVSALERMNGAHQPANALFFSMSSASRDALQAYLDLIYKEKVMPELSFTQAQGMQMSQMLNTGRVAMVAEAVPNLDFIAAMNAEWDVAPFPRMGNQQPAYFRSASGGLSISSSCAHADKAWALIKWLVTRSPYNTPNPVFKDVDFIRGWEEKHAQLRGTHFGQVWRLSEQFDGGDTRDFVRFFSWSSATILEQLSPKMDRLFAGQLAVDELAASAHVINVQVRDELAKVLGNPNIKPVFREKIREKLAQYAEIAEDEPIAPK